MSPEGVFRRLREAGGAGRGRSSRRLAWALGLLVLFVSVAVLWQHVDRDALRLAWRSARGAPLLAAVVLALYGSAFLLRAVAWRRLLPDLGLGHALAGIHLALGGNHVLPLRLGEPLRVASVVRRAGVSTAAATASTLTLRAGDLLALAVLAVGLGVGGRGWLAGWGAALLVVPLGGAVAGAAWLWRQRRAGGRPVRLPGPAVSAATAGAWGLEASVVWYAAHLAGVELSAAEAVAVTAVTVAGQVAAVAPAGVGTYEAAGTAALVALGVPPGTGLAVAVTAHALKTAYALVAGGVGLVVPAPGLLGRLRLPRRAALSPSPARPRPEAPVVLFLPARNEAPTVADVVARVPARVGDHPVRCLVVDDGSTDDTAARAARAGADVVSLDAPRGLGAAVRRGLAEAVDQHPAAVAFCDADGEYAPEELAAVVGPVLRGEADYVVGSRFSGRIGHMHPHRRLGNAVLTRLLSFVTRRHLTDGQSGYRALSPDAAAAAEVAHDYNYAQVLTLDLLGKGYSYAEVGISYRFRRHGRSFVRLLPYLQRVLPAMWRVVNREPGRPAPWALRGQSSTT